MHPTVKPKGRPDFEVTEGEYQYYQENILTFLYHKDSATEKQLLPTCFYQEHKLEGALSSLLEKGMVVEKEEDGETVYVRDL